ncbi:hypothetical protein VKS41_005030 [Umbelopsis sp. WA50703]
MTTLFDDRLPGVIDLSIGAPSRDLMPVDMVAAACRAALSSSEKAWDSFQYGPEDGDHQYRQELATLLSDEYNALGSVATGHE